MPIKEGKEVFEKKEGKVIKSIYSLEYFEVANLVTKGVEKRSKWRHFQPKPLTTTIANE